MHVPQLPLCYAQNVKSVTSLLCNRHSVHSSCLLWEQLCIAAHPSRSSHRGDCYLTAMPAEKLTFQVDYAMDRQWNRCALQDAMQLGSCRRLAIAPCTPCDTDRDRHIAVTYECLMLAHFDTGPRHYLGAPVLDALHVWGSGRPSPGARLPRTSDIATF